MKYVIDKSTLDGIGNAIREKKGTTDLIQVPNLAEEILSIQSGGLDGIQVETGTFTPNQDIICATQQSHELYAIEHHLGKIPFRVDLFIEECVSSAQGTINNARCGILVRYSRNVNNINYKWYENTVFRTNSDSGGYASTSLGSSCAYPFTEGATDNLMFYADENNIYIGNKNSPNAYQYILRAGNTYRWVAYTSEVYD